MKIKKTFQGELPENRIVNTYSNSLTDAYSANYLNDKLKSVEVSSTEPTNGKDIWVQMGKNLFNKNSKLVSGKYLASDGTIGDDANLFYQETYIPVEPNTSYVISNENNENHRICEYDANKTFLTRFLNDNASSSCIFTSGPSTKFIRISCRIDNIDSLQIEQGEFKTDYEPYIPKKIYVKKDNKYELVYDEANTRKEVYVGPTAPKSGEEVWIQKGENLFDISKLSFSNGAVVDYENETITVNTYYNPANQKLKDIAPKLVVGETYVLGMVKEGAQYIYLNGSSSVWSIGTAHTITQAELDGSVFFYGFDHGVGDGIPLVMRDISIEKGNKLTRNIFIKNKNNVYESVYRQNDLLDVYDTQEQRIGTWTDGKPLYRRLIMGDIADNATLVSNVDTLVSAEGTGDINSIYRVVPYYEIWGDKVYSLLVNKNFSNEIKTVIYRAGEPSTAPNCKIVLKYTKTTD